MQISPGIYMLEISIDLLGHKDAVYPVMLTCPGGNASDTQSPAGCNSAGGILVDAAYPGQARKIRAAIEACEIPFESISRVIITHHDIDHMGSLSAILKMLPAGVQVLAHEAELPYITGQKPPAKWNPGTVSGMEAQLGKLDAARKLAIKAVFDHYHLLAARVDQTLADGDLLPICGGIKIIGTPGHSPGHICLYHLPSRILIAGDALFVSEGQLWATPPFLNLDQEQYRSSLCRLLNLDIHAVCCYHGGFFAKAVNERIAELAAIC